MPVRTAGRSAPSHPIGNRSFCRGYDGVRSSLPNPAVTAPVVGSAGEIQCQSGIAPVTRQSGKSRRVSRRYACPKFLRQTFHKFADRARKWSRWAKAFYEMKRAAGFRHHAAVRALAYKCIRIIFQLWKTRTIYNENLYIEQLKKRHPPQNLVVDLKPIRAQVPRFTVFSGDLGDK